MPWTPPSLPTGLSDRLAFIIAGLRGLLAAHVVKDRSAVAVIFLAWTRLGRLASRFEAVVAAVRAGRLPSAAAPRVQGGQDLELPRLEGLPQPYRLPAGFGWLIRLVPGTAAYAGQVQQLLADPEMAALLADVPQAGRILGPLCRMLGIRSGPEFFAPRRRSPCKRSARASRAASSLGPNPRAGFGSAPTGSTEPLPAKREPPALLLGRPVDAGADPPLSVPWRRSVPG